MGDFMSNREGMSKSTGRSKDKGANGEDNKGDKDAPETREQQMPARFSKLNPATGSGSRTYQTTRISDLAGTEFSPVEHKRARGASPSSTSSILGEPR